MTVDLSEQKTAAAGSDVPVSARRDTVSYRRIGVLSSAKRDPATAESTYFVKASGPDLLEFGEKEYFLWRLLDGTNSIPSIRSKFEDRFGAVLTPEQFDGFVDQLVDCGALEVQGAREAALQASGPTRALPPPAAEPLEPALRVAAASRNRGIPLFDPSLGLRALDTLCGPFRFFQWLLLPAVLGVLLWSALDPSAMTADLAVPSPGYAAGIMVLALLLVGIVPPLTQAATASFLGYGTRECRIAFRGSVFPQLAFNDSGWAGMLPAHVLQVVGAPCAARLALFTAGAGVWLATRTSDTRISHLALAVTVLSLASFLISAAPFLPSQGRRWLTAAFGVADPWRAGAGYCLHLVVLSVFWLVIAVGALGIAAVAILQSLAPGWYDPATTETVRSAALPLMLVTAAVAGPWLRGMLNSYGTLQPSYALAGGRPQGFDTGYALDPGLRSSQMLVEGTVARGRRQSPERWPATTSIKIWATILGCIVAVAFVMYPYEAGGYFTILPHDSSQLNARVQGELTEVLVNEGEEVKPGQILGILSDWQQKYNLELNKAQLQSAQANLQHLLETPRPEDVELARKQYEGALARLPYDKAQFERYAALVTNDNVSRSNYDQVLSQYQQDQAAADVARANYDQVRVPPTQAQIDASRALVRQYTASVAFAEDELERTRIRATSYGTMVTQNPMLLRGKYFAQGALAFTVEDHKVLQADVQVPETDIDNVQLGGPVRLRFWGSPDKTFPGKAISIAPAGQTPTSAAPQTPQSGSSNVIRIRALVPNPDGQLHTNTDGYAKMAGAYMPTWRAFGQMLQRFFLVEIWSWVP